jgi:hypothetical protein
MYTMTVGATIFSLILFLAPNSGFSAENIKGNWSGESEVGFDLIKTGRKIKGDGVKLVVKICLAKDAIASAINIEGWDGDFEKLTILKLFKDTTRKNCAVTYGSNVIIKTIGGKDKGTFELSR